MSTDKKFNFIPVVTSAIVIHSKVIQIETKDDKGNKNTIPALDMFLAFSLKSYNDDLFPAIEDFRREYGRRYQENIYDMREGDKNKVLLEDLGEGYGYLKRVKMYLSNRTNMVLLNDGNQTSAENIQKGDEIIINGQLRASVRNNIMTLTCKKVFIKQAQKVSLTYVEPRTEYDDLFDKMVNENKVAETATEKVEEDIEF